MFPSCGDPAYSNTQATTPTLATQGGDPQSLGADRSGPDALLQKFYATESQKRLQLTAAGAPPFDIILLHVCSLSWDDIEFIEADTITRCSSALMWCSPTSTAQPATVARPRCAYCTAPAVGRPTRSYTKGSIPSATCFQIWRSWAIRPPAC